MPSIKEYREFFLRNTKVLKGNKKDQESNFPVDYLVRGIKKFNRFLRGNVPSEDIVSKLFESITFKLNQEDTANTSIQGLVMKATDGDSESRALNPNTEYTKSVTTHQLPEIVLSTDGSDSVIGSPVSNNGIKLTILRRTLFALFRRNYKIEVITDKSITIDGTSKKLQLINDVLSPSANSFYGTDSGGSKGWIAFPSKILFRKSQILLNDMASTDTTPILIQYNTSMFTATLVGGRYYKFKTQIFVNPSVSGFKIGFIGTITGAVIASAVYIDDIATAAGGGNLIGGTSRVGSFSDTIDSVGGGNGTIVIEGYILPNSASTFGISFALSTGTTTSRVLKGSSFLVEEYEVN